MTIANTYLYKTIPTMDSSINGYFDNLQHRHIAA